MNPAYGRAVAGESEEDAREAARNGELKHVAVHPQKDGGFSVHAHYEHPKAGHHTVESKHASAEEAAEEVKRHLRGHEARCARRNDEAGESDEDE